jgi:tRNA-specific 2-thiouridylase
VRCNQFVKFAAFWDRARELGAELIATGHYARLRTAAGGIELLRGADADKDQSYFLFGVDPGVLRQTRFPVGELCKAEVRAEAQRRGLAVAGKPDSQEVCFAPGRGGAPPPSARRRCRCGRAWSSTSTARWWRAHGGVHRFTIGQRRGLGVVMTRRAMSAKSTPSAASCTWSGRVGQADGLRRWANWLAAIRRPARG